MVYEQNNDRSVAVPKQCFGTLSDFREEKGNSIIYLIYLYLNAHFLSHALSCGFFILYTLCLLNL